MDNHSKESNSLLDLVLPKGILAYFTVSNIEHTEETVNIYLSENNIVPQEYINDKLVSKGFFDEIRIQDFPLRGKDVYLLIKRRRWLNESTGDTVVRNWDMVAKGTRMTKEFAAFLKVVSRFQTGALAITLV
ncbi:MAG: transposase [Bacteroidetes bacterium]|nr:transposase [Bacteroidota bacterium]